MSVTEIKDARTFIVSNDQDNDFAVIPIREKVGMISLTSWNGSYSYQWSAMGTDLLSFLGSLNFDYFWTKMMGRKRLYPFDGENAIKRLRYEVCRARREGRADKDIARDAYNAIDDIEETDDESYMLSQVGGSGEILQAIGHDDWWGCVEGHRTNHNAIYLWNTFIVPFAKHHRPDAKIKEYIEK